MAESIRVSAHQRGDAKTFFRLKELSLRRIIILIAGYRHYRYHSMNPGSCHPRSGFPKVLFCSSKPHANGYLIKHKNAFHSAGFSRAMLLRRNASRMLLGFHVLHPFSRADPSTKNGEGRVPLSIVPSILTQNLVCCFLSELRGVKVVIVPMQIEQFSVRSTFGNFTAADHQDAVRIADGGKPMRHDKACAVLQHLGNCILNELLGFRIDGACGFIQHEDARIC